MPNLKILSDSAKLDLILSFMEASRFSDVRWKRHAIALAKKALQQVNDPYLHAYVAQRDCAISRTFGDTDGSALALSSFAIHLMPPQPIRIWYLASVSHS